MTTNATKPLFPPRGSGSRSPRRGGNSGFTGVSLKGLLMDKGGWSAQRHELLAQLVAENDLLNARKLALYDHWRALPQNILSLTRETRGKGSGIDVIFMRWRLLSSTGVVGTKERINADSTEDMLLLRQCLQDVHNGDYVWDQFISYNAVLENLKIRAKFVAAQIRLAMDGGYGDALEGMVKPQHISSARSILRDLDAMIGQ